MKCQTTALVSWAVSALASLAVAQGQPYYYTGAITAAVPAQCPADHPVGCSAISQSDHCCPANNYCAWVNSVVACCPYGQTCSGWYQQPTTTWWQPSPTTYYAPPPTTVVTAPVVVVPPQYATTQYVTQPTPRPNQIYAGYCSTLYETGPNLPTTAQGNCGTILVTNPSHAARLERSVVRIGILVGAMHIFGGILCRWR